MISAGGPVTPTMVEKAWGRELWFTVMDNAYAGKVIDIAAGQAVSLHRHRAKTETIIVLSGTGVAELGPTRNNLTSDGWIDDVERIEERSGLAAAQEG